MQFDAHPLIFENGLEQMPGKGRNMRQTTYRTGAVERFDSNYGNLGGLLGSSGTPSGPVATTPGKGFNIYGPGGVSAPGSTGIKGYHWQNPVDWTTIAVVNGTQLIAADLAGMFLANQEFLDVATALDGGAGYALGIVAFYWAGQYLPYSGNPLVQGLAPAVVPLLFGGSAEMLAVMGLAGAAGLYAGGQYMNAN